MSLENDQSISATAKALVELIRTQQAADLRILVPPVVAQQMLGLGATRIRELMDSDELASQLDGRARRVYLWSIYDRLVKNAIASNPVNGPRAKANPFRGRRPQEQPKASRRGGARPGAGRPKRKGDQPKR